MYNMQRPYPSAPAAEAPVTATLPYLRKVYSLFSAGIAFSIAGALLALYAGTPVSVPLEHGESLALPPLVAFGLEHYWVMMIVFFGAFFAASSLRRRPGINLVALFGFTLVAGVFIAPMLFVAQYMASQGQTLDPSPVRDAFLLTGAAFTGLTTYVFVSKKDFSFLGAGLSMGTMVVFGALILGLFVHAEVFHLAIASVGVLLFAGYILFDTSRILRTRDESEPVGAALRLFLDVFNLFIFLLRILSSRRN